MATQRQIEANQRSAGRSTGPKSDDGKARSRTNATKHGMAAGLPGVEADFSPEFVERRARWAAEQNPVGEAGEWALDQAVAATLRIERCGRTIDGLIATTQERARLAWDQDRAVEAATLFGRLAKDPVLASRQLETTLAGVGLLIETWFGLLAPLQAGEDWSESEAAEALDLLGVAPDARSHRTPIGPPEGADPVAFRLALALDEVDRLEALRDEAMAPLDEMERRRAMAGGTALLAKPVKLALRYERDAWRRYNDAMKQLKAQAPPPAVAPTLPEPPRLREPAATPPAPSPEEPRRAMQAEPEPIEEDVDAVLAELGIEDEEAWLDEMERRIDAIPASRLRPLATERTQFGEVAIA